MRRIKIKFRAVLSEKEGKKVVRIVNRPYYQHLLNKFDTGEVIWVSIENKKAKRSLPQNSLYWLYLTVIAEHTGHTPEELHEFCKINYLPKRIINLKGKQYALTGSTTHLSKGEFVEFMMQVEALAGTLGIELPDPKELDIAILK